jgi:excisionase family DNA binding protein
MDQRISPRRRPFLTFGEVAEWPGCTERMVRKPRTTRQLPSVKVGRLVRFEPRDVDEDLSRHRLEVTA